MTSKDWDEISTLWEADELDAFEAGELAQAVQLVRFVIEEYDNKVGGDMHDGMFLPPTFAKRLREAVGMEAPNEA